MSDQINIEIEAQPVPIVTIKVDEDSSQNAENAAARAEAAADRAEDAVDDIDGKIADKLDKGGYTGTAKDLSDKFETKADVINGLVPAWQLPSFVDDILEGYLSSNVFYKEEGHVNVITAETGKIYVDITTGQKNRQYRYTGSNFIQITNGFIASSDDVPEGSSNKYFSTANITAILNTTWLGSLISSLTGKTSIADGDSFVFSDNADEGKAKKITWLDFKALFKTIGGFSIFGTGNIEISATTKRTARWWALGAASGMSQQGSLLDYPLILTGTKVSQTTITYTNLITSIPRLVYRSPSTAGASCGVATGSGSVRPFSTKSGIDLKLNFDTSDGTPVATSRIAAGISALTVDMGNINPSTMVSTILVGNDTGDTNLFLMHNDSAGTCTKINLGSNFPHNTINCIYELFIKTDPDTTVYKVTINRYDNTSPSKNPIFSYTTELSLNVPNTQLSWFVTRNNGATASPVEVGVSSVENKYFY